MAEEQSNGADVAVEIAGQKVNLRNIKSLNTLATVASLIILILASYMLFMHTTEAKDQAKEIAKELKDANKEVANALKESNRELGIILRELSQAAREQNCLIARTYSGMPVERRAEEVELCKRLSR
jgi:short subunit fatty acids transporter